MEYRAAASYANHVEFDWEEKLRVLVQIWEWIDYAVVWKLAPHNRDLEWSTGYFNDRSCSWDTNPRRLSYSVYKSCAFTSSSSRCAAKALSQRAPLWWTSNSPRLPTDEPKDQTFSQQSTPKTIVCLPGHGSDANMYCLELASTNLIMESSALWYELQAVVSGTYVLPGPPFASNRNLRGPWSGGDSERTLRVGGAGTVTQAAAAAAAASSSSSLEQFRGALETNQLQGSHRFNPAGNGPCAAPGAVESVLDTFEEELSAASSNLVGPEHWFNAQKFGIVPDQTFGTPPPPHVGSSRMMGTVRDEEMALAVQQDGTVGAPGSVTTSHGPEATVSTEMMVNLWASMSDADVEAQMPGISSILSRPAFDSLEMAFEDARATTFAAAGDQHMSEVAATSSGSCFGNALTGSNLAGYDQEVLAFHLVHGQTSSAPTSSNSSYETLYTNCPEARALSSDASMEVPDSMISRRRRSLAPELDASLHLDRLLLAQRGDSHSAAAVLGVVIDQAAAMNPASGTDYAQTAGAQAAFENPFHEQPTSTESVSRNLSRFESLEPANRQSKHPRFDDSGAAQESATEQQRRQPIIELWKNQLVPKIQEPDKTQRRLASEQHKVLALDNDNSSPTSTLQQQQQQQLLSAPGAAAAATARTNTIPAAPDSEMGDVPSELINFSPGWHDDQKHIAHNHKLAERDRRQKFKTKILTLRSIIPPIKKNDKLSMLSNAIDYIRELKTQIAGLQKPAASSQENMNPVCQTPTARSLAAGVNLLPILPTANSMTTAVNVLAPSSSTSRIINSNTSHTVAVSVEVGAKASDSGASALLPDSLIIKVQAPNHPQTLIQILTAVRDLELEIGSFMSSSLTDGRVNVSVSVLVCSDSQRQQTSSWYCNEVQESLERTLNPQNHGLDTSASTNSDPQIQKEQQRVRSKSV